MSLANSRRVAHIHQTRKTIPSSSLVLMIIVMSSLVITGVIFCATLAPTHESGSHGPSTNSIIGADRSSRSLSQKLLDWLPSHHLHPGRESEEDNEENNPPDWSQEFWSPIDVDVSYDPMITLCKLNFRKYSENPHLYPMFRDLEGISSCSGSRKRKERLSVLMAEIKSQQGTPGGRVIEPSGFVFLESRVGSTLVANTLASDPWSMVFSESAPAANALLHCTTCDRKRSVQLFRDVVTLMGRSPFHKRLFFKFQSITSTKMEIALEAFPNVSWAFVYRQPVQTMMSHLDPDKGGTAGAPCLRSMRSPPEEVANTISKAVGMRNPPKEAWCAAHLNMLCNSALRAFEKYGIGVDSHGIVKQRGFLVNYDSLPGIVPRVLLPMFNVVPKKKWLSKMNDESAFYSKSRGVDRKFLGDSKDKDSRATKEIQEFSTSILQPTYERLTAASVQALQRHDPKLGGQLKPSVDRPLDWDWKVFSTIPEVVFGSVVGSQEGKIVVLPDSFTAGNGSGTDGSLAGHSNAIPEVDFAPWAPFSNTHSSKSFENAHCPDEPEEDYPKTYSILDITNNWNTDNTEIPEFHYDALCHFDYTNPVDNKKAWNYRAKEKPFVVYNIPEVLEVSKKWNNIDYLHKKLGNTKYRTETSKDNHFMYWNGGGARFLRGNSGEKWTPPTGLAQVTFEDWLELAVKGQNKTLESRTHQYFRVSSDMGNEWLFDELPFFQPKKSLWMVEPREQRGIHCRFGMRSVIAEAHFDGSRNTIAMLGGMRRWILTHPNQCENMHMLSNGHPSARHSAVDWSKPDLEAFPNFAKIRANEVIMRPGDVLYLPTYWIHYIISLNVNFQCNTRSGRTSHFDKDIHKCGF